MGDFFKKVWGQVDEFLGDLSIGKRIGLLFLLVVVATGMVLTFQWAGQQNYKTLMTNLGADDSANIIRILREKKIPFRVGMDGKTIAIPPELVFDLRLELATLGLPDSSNVGYEVFDKQSLGTTSFVQKVNRKRALEGELMRTINTMRGVKRSRVHIAVPKKSTFVEEQQEPTASVVIDLMPGVRMNEKQIYGIGRLVANAVEGLDVSDVVIIDANGKQLSKNVRDPLVALTADQLDYQRKLEEDMERRIVQVLSPVVGEGKVVAKVNASLDFSEVQETQTIYDPDGAAVRSSQKNTSSMKGARPGPYGRPGAATNQPGAEENQRQVAQTTTDTQKDNNLTNYEIPKTIRKTRKPIGLVQKLSVAVIMDGQVVQAEGENGEITSKVQPWPAEKMAEFEALVSSAVGFNKKRGDILDVKSIEFTREDFKDAEEAIQQSERRNYFMNLITWTVIGLVIVLFFVFVVRPFIKWITENTIDSVDTFLPQTIEELEKMQSNQNIQQLEEVMPALPEKIDPEKVEGEMIKEKIITLVDNNPHKAALVIREWVRGIPEDEKGKDKSA